MTSDELRKLIEPLIIETCNTGRKPDIRLARIAKQWMSESGLDFEDCMNEFNLVVADIVDRHNLRRH